MPIETKEVLTASGHLIVRSIYRQEVSEADAQAYIDKCKAGGPWEHAGHLATGQVTSLSASVRAVLESQKPPDPSNMPPVACIIPSAMMRMIASLVTRTTGNSNTEFFKSDSEAIAWLERALATYEAKRARKP